MRFTRPGARKRRTVPRRYLPADRLAGVRFVVAGLRARFLGASTRGPAATRRAARDFLRAALFGCRARRAAALSMSLTSEACSPSIVDVSPPSRPRCSRRKYVLIADL